MGLDEFVDMIRTYANLQTTVSKKYLKYSKETKGRKKDEYLGVSKHAEEVAKDLYKILSSLEN